MNEKKAWMSVLKPMIEHIQNDLTYNNNLSVTRLLISAVNSFFFNVISDIRNRILFYFLHGPSVSLRISSVQ